MTNSNINESDLVRMDSVEDVTINKNDEPCSYPGCSNNADYYVTGRKDGQEATFPACHICAWVNGIRPVDHGVERP